MKLTFLSSKIIGFISLSLLTEVDMKILENTQNFLLKNTWILILTLETAVCQVSLKWQHLKISFTNLIVTTTLPLFIIWNLFFFFLLEGKISPRNTKSCHILALYWVIAHHLFSAIIAKFLASERSNGEYFLYFYFRDVGQIYNW